MAEYFFIAATSLMNEFSLESPSDGLPSLQCYEISLDARVQLYSLLTSRPLDECYENEILLPISEAANSTYYQLDTNLVDQLSQLDEGSADLIMEDWLATKDLEEAKIDRADPTDFLLNLIHFCKIASHDKELGIFLYSEG